MNIFWKRKDNQNPPRSEDSILQHHKFTNAYRVLDRESQYLVSQIINPFAGKPEDLILNIILYKIFNKSQTWEYILTTLGHYPTIESFDPKVLSTILSQLQTNQPIFNNAYMMTGSSSRYHLDSKHETWLTILQKEFVPLIPRLLESKSLKELYEKLRQITFFGPFIAMQYAIDLNYSPLWKFDENKFIIAGIGARRGIEKCFDSFQSYEGVIYWIRDNFDNLMQKFGLQARLLPGRKPTLIDLQGGFCETDKYLRGINPSIGKKVMRIKQIYKSDYNKSSILYTFPKRWNMQL